MQKKIAARNIIIALSTQIVIVVLTFITRRALIANLGIEANGIYALFLSIFGFLGIVELGFLAAITYNLYKPIVNNDYDTVTALYLLCRKIFRYVTLIMFVVGLVIIPLIPLLATGQTGTFNIYLNYSIFLVASIIPFLVVHKIAFIEAHKHNHITRILRSGAMILQQLLQLLVLYFFNSFELYLGSMILLNLVYIVLVYFIFKSKYSFLLTDNRALDLLVKRSVIEKTKAQFMHKIGSLVVFSMSNILISLMVSVVTLGYYSNYIMIVSGGVSLTALVFTTLAPFVGHAFATQNKDSFENLFEKIYSINVALGILLFLGFYAVTDQLIAVVFGYEYLLDRNIVLVIAISSFITFIRRTFWIFRESTGTFYNDRYRPLVEAVINVGLAVLFIHLWGIVGALLATIVTDLLLNHIIEPYVIYKYAIEKRANKFLINDYIVIVLFTIAILVFDYIPILMNTYDFVALIVNGFISVAASGLLVFVLFLVSSIVRNSIISGFKMIFKKVKQSYKYL